MPSKKLSLFVLPVVATLSLQANDPFGDDIFKEMMHMQQNMDKIFNRMQQNSSSFVKPLSRYKTLQQERFVDKGDHYAYMTNIPESKENEIDIHAKDGEMSIRAKIIQKQVSKTANSYSSSSSMRMYQQSIPLPKDADEGSLKATYKSGKLIISVDKKIIQKTIPTKKENTTKENTTKEHNNSQKKLIINSDVSSMS
jgi:HSP20 family molecular chaperone IbpA